MHAAFPTDMFTGPAYSYFIDTVRNVTGIKLIPDASGGDPNGAVYVPDVSARECSRYPVANILFDGRA